MHEKIATIINYCSNDFPFLKDCVFQAKKFSSRVIVVVSDHFFDGRKEDLEELENSFLAYDFVTFIIYPFIPQKIPRRIFKKVRKSSLWHSVSRMVGTSLLDNDIEHVLFLDVDEIVDGDKFKLWLNEKKYLTYDALRPANYWYFRSTSSQAKDWEDSALFIKTNKINKKSLLDSNERDAIFNAVKGNKKRMVLGLDNLPMIHHYSWVKTKKQMIVKTRAWGHKNDKDWESLIENEFKRKESTRDFVHGYDLMKVTPFAKIDMDSFEDKKIETTKNRQKNIIYLSEKKLLRMVEKRSFKDYICCLLEKINFFNRNKSTLDT